jgi:hypothetical protein
VAARPPPPQSRFGAHPEHPKVLRLAGGSTFAVYRVMC